MALPNHYSPSLALILSLVSTLAACGAPEVVREPLTDYAKAVTARDQGRLDKAQRLVQPQADAGDVQAILLLAEIQMRRGRHRDAASRLMPLFKNHPDNGEVAGLLARSSWGSRLLRGSRRRPATC